MSAHFSRRPPVFIISFALVLLSNFTRAQAINRDTTIDIEPYKKVLTKKISPVKTVKKQVDTKFSREFHHYDDTVGIQLYNTHGDLINSWLFDRDHKKKLTTYSYHHKNGLSGITSSGMDGRDYATRFIDTLFNSDSTIAAIQTNVVIKNDTAYRYLYKFKYNAARQCISKTFLGNGSLINYENYYYENGRLFKIENIQNLQLKNTYRETLFTYNPDGSLLKREKFNVKNGKSSLIGFNEYHYKNRILIQEKYGELVFVMEETNVQYEYNENLQLTKLLIQKDTLKKSIFYQYDGRKLSKVHIETNAASGLDREYSTQIYTFTEKKRPIIYDAEYSYDSNGNLVYERRLLNGELRTELRHEYEYY